MTTRTHLQPYISIEDYGEGCFAILLADGPNTDFEFRTGWIFRANEPMSDSSVRMLRELADKAEMIICRERTG